MQQAAASKRFGEAAAFALFEDERAVYSAAAEAFGHAASGFLPVAATKRPGISASTLGSMERASELRRDSMLITASTS
jgi:hypothetical protein